MPDHTESIFHITDAADATRLNVGGSLAPPSLRSEGYVHCSTAAQVVATTERYFDADADLVLIELDVGALHHDLRWPEVYPGQRFPHLYGPVLAAAVIRVHPWGPVERSAWPG